MYKRSLLILALQNQVSAFWTSSRKFLYYDIHTVCSKKVILCSQASTRILKNELVLLKDKNSYQSLNLLTRNYAIFITFYVLFQENQSIQPELKIRATNMCQ